MSENLDSISFAAKAFKKLVTMKYGVNQNKYRDYNGYNYLI